MTGVFSKRRRVSALAASGRSLPPSTSETVRKVVGCGRAPRRPTTKSRKTFSLRCARSHPTCHLPSVSDSLSLLAAPCLPIPAATPFVVTVAGVGHGARMRFEPPYPPRLRDAEFPKTDHQSQEQAGHAQGDLVESGKRRADRTIAASAKGHDPAGQNQKCDGSIPAIANPIAVGRGKHQHEDRGRSSTPPAGRSTIVGPRPTRRNRTPSGFPEWPPFAGTVPRGREARPRSAAWRTRPGGRELPQSDVCRSLAAKRYTGQAMAKTAVSRPCSPLR